MNIRPFKLSDIDRIARLFHDTVRTVNSIDYTERQIIAWAPDNIYFRDWAKECSLKFTYVAEQDDIIVGFAELEENGHIDCFYCHKDFLRKGIGKSLFQAIEAKAKKMSIKKLYGGVSITAVPFFQKMGFRVVKKQEANTRGVALENFEMVKLLNE